MSVQIGKHYRGHTPQPWADAPVLNAFLGQPCERQSKAWPVVAVVIVAFCCAILVGGMLS